MPQNADSHKKDKKKDPKKKIQEDKQPDPYGSSGARILKIQIRSIPDFVQKK